MAGKFSGALRGRRVRLCIEGVASNTVRARGRLSPLANIALAARNNVPFYVVVSRVFRKNSLFQHQCGFPVREAAHYPSSPAYFAVEPFKDVVGPDIAPVFTGEL